MHEHDHDELDHKLMIKALMISLNRAIGPKYHAKMIGDSFDLNPEALAQGVEVECTEGEADPDEIRQLMTAFMENPNSPFLFTEETPEYEPDDLLKTFTDIHELETTPEIAMFQAEMLDHFRLSHGTVGAALYEMIRVLKHGGVDEDLASQVLKLANNIYREGADMQAFTVARMSQWDRDHDNPSSIVLAGRTKAKFDEEDYDAEDKVIQERLQALYHLKHHWRYHQSNYVDFNKELFLGLWNDPST